MKANNSNLWRERVLRYAPLIIWIGVILFASTGSASMSETSRFIRPLLHFLFPDSPEETLIIYHGFIRKFAHFAEYAVLSFWAARAFWSSSIQTLRKFWFAFAFLAVLFVASIDEFNQSFNAARTGSIYDVTLDCAGGLTMILLLCLYRILIRKPF
ncbi:MAG TPA: VanZ family protein [Pyrinomonadaceae bacterium]|nr:VanZ family protein [Pyrinomonadaceae bacterium]